MIDEITKKIVSFPGAPNRTQCFAHIINLVSKSLLKQFDVPKAKADDALDEAVNELRKLAADIDKDERAAQEDYEADDNDEDDDSSDLTDWDSVVDGMTADELAELQESVQPVGLLLVKVYFPVFLFFS